MQKTVSAVALLLISLVAISCDPPQQTSANDKSAKSPASATNENMEQKVASLEASVKNLQTRVFSLELASHRFESGFLDPSDPAFARVDAASGLRSFAISITDVKPFGDGVQVTLRLGNPSTARFHGAKLTVSYGSREPQFGQANFPDKYAAWSNGLQKKQIDLSEDIKPGSWNPVTIALPGISADKFGYLNVSIDTNEIVLYKM